MSSLHSTPLPDPLARADPDRITKLANRYNGIKADSNSAHSNDTFDAVSSAYSVSGGGGGGGGSSSRSAIPAMAKSNKRLPSDASLGGGASEVKRNKRKQDEPKKLDPNKRIARQGTLPFAGPPVSPPKRNASPSSSKLRIEKETASSVTALKAEKLIIENQRLNEELLAQRKRNKELEEELQARDQQQDKSHEVQSQYLSAMIPLLQDSALADYDRSRATAARDRLRIGGPVKIQRSLRTYEEVWEPGSAYEDIRRKRLDIRAREQRLAASKKDRLKRGKEAAKSNSKQGTDGTTFKEPVVNTTEHRIQELLNQSNTDAIKKEKLECDRIERELEREKVLLVRDLKRISDEDESKYCWYNLSKENNKGEIIILNEQYALMCLLGKGGFSEVFKAYDLKNCMMVACKIHQVLSNWNEAKKHNYIKHATREYDIHKTLDHKNVTKLYDVFEIDGNSFCTVMEYCDGYDLDLLLKQSETLPEKDAKCKIAQVIQALKYLHTPVEGSLTSVKREAIIHYDLKPANILLVNGEVKLTDFGLSKQMTHEDEFATSMELTSQGAGTYWYLPPECFEAHARISSKVDVWSVGVIYFQLLFGRRPFGHNQSQQSILQQQTILNAKDVNFPKDPKVSEDAKKFIRSCLTRRVDDRPDVNKLFELLNLSKRGTRK